MKRRATIRDIARQSGFSRSTVSLVLNDSPHVSEETRSKILEVMRQLDYHPSSAARTLAGRKPHTIGVVFPKVSSCFSDCYFADALAGIADAVSERHYQLLLEFATPSYKRHGAFLESFKAKRVEGFLYVGAWDSDTYIREVASGGCPVVLVNSRMEGVPSVLADNASGAYRVIEHLVTLGHKRIGVITSPMNVTTSQDRLDGYRKALSDYGVMPPDELFVAGDFSELGGDAAADILLDRCPEITAIAAANDMMAIGAMNALRSRGYRVPEDVSVVGADDIRLAKYVQPALTTVRTPIQHIGQQAARWLLNMIAGEESGFVEEVVPTDLVVRRSTAPERIVAPLVNL